MFCVFLALGGGLGRFFVAVFAQNCSKFQIILSFAREGAGFGEVFYPVETGFAAGFKDFLDRDWSEPRDAEQFILRGAVYVYREVFRMILCPYFFRVGVERQLAIAVKDYLGVCESVFAHEKVDLVEAVFAHEVIGGFVVGQVVEESALRGRAVLLCRAAGAVRGRRELAEVVLVGAEVDALEVEAAVQGAHVTNDVGVGFAGGAYYELGGLLDAGMAHAFAGEAADELYGSDDVVEEVFAV